MTLLIAGLVIFLGVHSVSIVAPAWRDRIAARLGHAWRGIYALISIAGFVLLVWGYVEARQVPVLVYAPPASLRHVTHLLMLPVFPLLFATYLPGRIEAVVRHPMLLATLLWASAHLFSNGMLADILLFGGFFAWALADRLSFQRRTQRPIQTAPKFKYNDWIAVLAGLAIYGLFIGWAHLKLFGVSAL